MLSTTSRAGAVRRCQPPQSAIAQVAVRSLSSGDGGRARRPVARQTSINSGSFRSLEGESGDGAAQTPKVSSPGMPCL
jgi:hypothetical protein